MERDKSPVRTPVPPIQPPTPPTKTPAPPNQTPKVPIVIRNTILDDLKKAIESQSIQVLYSQIFAIMDLFNVC